MTSASWRFGEGQSCPSRSFPVRTSQRGRKEGAGHWLVAHRKAEEQTSRAALRRIKENLRQREDEQADTPRGVTLDGHLLLQLHCVDEQKTTPGAAPVS